MVVSMVVMMAVDIEIAVRDTVTYDSRSRGQVTSQSDLPLSFNDEPNDAQNEKKHPFIMKVNDEHMMLHNVCNQLLQ